MLSTTLPDRPAGLLDTMVSISLSGVALLRPVYAADGSLVDFAWAYLNPAGQQLLRQPEVPTASLREVFPAAADVFEQCRRAFFAGQVPPSPAKDQANDADGPFRLTAQRCDDLLAVSFTDPGAPARPAPEQAPRESQGREQAQRLIQELNEQLQNRTGEAEMARAAAERQRGELQRIFEQAPIAIAVYRGPRYVIELANATVARLWGRTQEQLIGKGLFEALPEVAGMGYEQLLDHVMQTGETHVAHAMEAQHDRNGQRETVYWDFVYVPVYDADGRIDGAMVVANEVTAQVLASRQLARYAQELETQVAERTRQLAQQSQRVERLVQEAPAAIALLDGPDLVFELLNDDYQSLFPDRALLGKPVLAAIPELYDTPLVEVLRHVYHTGETFEGLEFPIPFMAPDGQVQNRYFDFIYQARYDAAGTIDGLVLFGFEVTERVQRRLQTEALQAELLAINDELLASNTRLSHTNAELDTFVYTASHDLKAPITNIDGLLEVLRGEAAAGSWGETAGHLLTLMQDSIGRFRTTLGHLTEITHLQSEPESAAPIDLVSIIDGVELDLAPLLSVARAELRVEVADCPALRVPAKTARSVIYNLLSNALNYRSPERPPVVHIRCRQEAQQSVLEVEDNGLGIDLTRQTELFGMFRRYHTHVEGAGVGLYMVKRMVEHVGGRIEVRSQVGVGSTFTVWLPLPS